MWEQRGLYEKRHREHFHSFLTSASLHGSDPPPTDENSPRSTTVGIVGAGPTRQGQEEPCPMCWGQADGLGPWLQLTLAEVQEPRGRTVLDSFPQTKAVLEAQVSRGGFLARWWGTNTNAMRRRRRVVRAGGQLLLQHKASGSSKNPGHRMSPKDHSESLGAGLSNKQSRAVA